MVRHVIVPRAGEELGPHVRFVLVLKRKYSMIVRNAKRMSTLMMSNMNHNPSISLTANCCKICIRSSQAIISQDLHSQAIILVIE